MIMDTTNYRPQKHGFPYKLLKFLYDNGTSSGIVAQKEIGLNAWADAKGSIYWARASQSFDKTVSDLKQKGLVKILPDDFYALTKAGKEFMDSYINRR